jgi:two-component system sensor histidine kinase UhpB
MSLRLKINLVVGCLTALFVAALLGLHWRSMRDGVREEVVAANRVATQLLRATVASNGVHDVQAMLGFLAGVGRVRSNDITVVDAQDRELYRSPPSPYKAGRDAPDWFEALVAPPAVRQSIPLADGSLVVRSNASRAVLDAWDAFVVLGGAASALLLLVNGLVFRVVGRTVRPLAQVVVALNRLQAGRFDASLPPLAGREAAALGEAFNRMMGVLRANLENERRALRAERELGDNRELARWLDGQIEQERRMIARELHDEFGQSVTAVRSMALSIARRVQDADAQSAQAAQLIASESSRLYEAMHGLIPRLTPLVLEDFGLEEALCDLVDRTRRSHPAVGMELCVALDGIRPSGDTALALYRAAQEGITNALRHGQPTALRVELSVRDGELTLDIFDDGRGPAAQGSAESGHHGLRWLAERIESLGGRWGLEAALPRGARLYARVPMEAGTDAACA